MNITDIVILVVTIWGKTASGEWEYVGNQYVHQKPMTLTECSEFIAPKNWKTFADNEYYKIELACFYDDKDKT